MLKKRIIPCLDIKDGRVVKGVQFLALKDAGNPVELASFYSKNGADELVFLDTSATLEKRKTLAEMVTNWLKKSIFPSPLAVAFNRWKTLKYYCNPVPTK